MGKIRYEYYDNKNVDYIQSEIAHTERSMRAFLREGNMIMAKDREKHARKLWDIYHKK